MSMEVISLADAQRSLIAQRLKEGETLVYPTETCYGLGCDATNVTALQNIFAIKGRSENKPVILLFNGLDMLGEYTEITPTLRRLSDTYWPGALTIIVPIRSRGGLVHHVIASDNTIACRVSPHPFVQALVQALGRPFVSTSANRAGNPSPYTIEEVLTEFSSQKNQPDIVIDAGSLPRNKPSTIVRLVGDTLEIVRQGEIVVN